MGNHHNVPLKPEDAAKLKEKYQPIELAMLWMIYEDLSSRDFGAISKETFLKFFPLTVYMFLEVIDLKGLWGERLFERFDLNHTTYLTFFEFAYGIAKCCKSSEEEKIRLLFSLYDFDNDGFIEKKEMITMLYNYPKNHIKFITDEIAPDNGEKLAQITEAKRAESIANILENVVPQSSSSKESSVYQEELSSNIGDARKEEELPVADENKKEDQMFQVDRDIKNSFVFYKKAEERKRRESQIFSQKPILKTEVLDGHTKKKAIKINKPTTMIDLDNIPQDKPITKYMDMKPTRAASSAINRKMSPTNPLRISLSHKISGSTLIMDQSFVQSTTINTRVKEYASFMFRTFEAANARGKISFEEFKEWLTMHSIILKLFDETFHQDVWALRKNYLDFLRSNTGTNNNHNNQNHNNNNHHGKNNGLKIGYQFKMPEISGTLYKKGKKIKKWLSRYYELRGDFLFYFSHRGACPPRGIHFLEGCYVEELNDYVQTHKYGFRITHKSLSYQSHNLYVNEKKKFDEWMNHLKPFKSTSIHDMYQFCEKIGTGKFSIVYRAISKKNNSSEYAIKVINKDGLKPAEREFLISETSVMKVLNHPNVIKLIETIEAKSTIYIVTEIVKDGDLFEYIVTRDFLEEYEASYLMRQLFNAFYYLQSVEIVHRDIKPENIMISLTEDRQKVKEIKIIDFGFAKFITPGQMLKETCGTPNYVAPEVLKGVGYDKRADIWSLGIIMYLMLRGRLPFDSHNVDEILRNTLRAQVPLDEEHWDHVSSEELIILKIAKDLLLKLLQKDVNKRISLKEALRHPWITERDLLKKYMGANRCSDVSSGVGSALCLDQAEP